MPKKPDDRFTVVDLFSGAGGMSAGFARHADFKVVAAVDAENGKPSSGSGSLECNRTYVENIGIEPLQADLGEIPVEKLRKYVLRKCGNRTPDVLISCAPCTGFSRVVRHNLVNDDPRNGLVRRSADFVSAIKPKIFVMENVSELLKGRFKNHFQVLKSALEDLGYVVEADVHNLRRFGLPQNRLRSLVLAYRDEYPLVSLDQLWDRYEVDTDATTVRRAISDFEKLLAGECSSNDRNHVSPSMTAKSLKRLELIPNDGGSWPDLLLTSEGYEYLIPSMRKYADQGKVGPHRDVYGRLAWDKPAVTIKRECSHTGNGRYAHPDQNRLCTVRELATLQGFPLDYYFNAGSVSNMYRHVGDAVPPLISYQIASVCASALKKQVIPLPLHEIVLPNCSLTVEDILPAKPFCSGTGNLFGDHDVSSRPRY